MPTVTATRIDQGAMFLAGAVGAGLLTVGTAALALADTADTADTAQMKVRWAGAAVLASLVLAPLVLYTAVIPGILLRSIAGECTRTARKCRSNPASFWR